jgi:hypothetical protein
VLLVLDKDSISPGDDVRVLDDGAGTWFMTYNQGVTISRRAADLNPIWTYNNLGATYVGGVAPRLTSGHFVVFQKSTSTESYVYIKGRGPTGGRMPDWPENGYLLTSQPGAHVASKVLPDGSAGALVTWLDTPDGRSPGEIMGQHVGPDGGIPNGAANGVPLCTGAGQRLSHSLVPSIGPTALEIWQDTRNDGGDIYAQRIAWDAAVPVAYALVSAEAASDRVDLAWYGTGPSTGAVVERVLAGKDGWLELGRATTDGNGHLLFMDRVVVAGMRYGYRLRLPDGTTHGETWVTVPAMAQLSLLGAMPNPTSGPLKVSFSLANGRGAQLDLFDVSGRRVLSRDVGALGAGSHVLDLEMHLSAGVYLVRLEQDGRSLTRRALVIR